MAKSLLTVTLAIPDEDGDTLAEKVGIAQTTPESHLVFHGISELIENVSRLKPVQLGVAVDEYTASGQFANGAVAVVVTIGTHGSIANDDFTYIGGQKFIWKTSGTAGTNEVTIGADANGDATALAATATAYKAAGKPLYGILTSAIASTNTVTFTFTSPGAAGEFMVNYDQSGGVTFDVTDLKAVTTRTRKAGWKRLT